MRSLIATALVAVFLSAGITGCYTKLKGPQPGTGEKKYSDYQQQYDDYYYDYYDPFYFHNGWYSPYLYSYPSYYGYFFYPWWYDPYYFDGGRHYDGRSHGDKNIRNRRGGDNGQLPPVPGNSYSPPPSSGQGGQGYGQPSPPPRQRENPPPKNNSDKPREKSTRQRR